MFDKQGRYVIEDYQSKPPFSSFLPGIAGPMGVPVWCYYNNRGQAVCSFGARDKDHAIMEFSAAHTAYQSVSRTGFRTFCKIDGVYQELFTDHSSMHIAMSEVEITCQQNGLEASAVYFGVPGERVAALARILTVRNTEKTAVSLELLDGMPAMVCYGVNHFMLKNMANLSKAWMQAEDVDKGQACFRVRASMEDRAQVTEVKGCNFCLGLDENGTLLRALVQPELVYGQDSSLAKPEGFLSMPLEALCAQPQITQNLFPCCFLPRSLVLQPGESVSVFSLYGQAEDKSRVAALVERVTGGDWFVSKRQEAAELMDTLCAPISCRSANTSFDAYCRQTYLDNLLRGGAPTFFESEGKKTPFYMYSRKHGDPEREYNYFSLGGEYYAQGNGNFRDVSQNRRCSVLFAPQTGAEDIHTFFDLIQSDGYNPLVITASTYTLPKVALDEIMKKLPENCHAQAKTLLTSSFTPGMLAMALEDWGLGADTQKLTAAIICACDSEPNADFAEGYWCDHWTYNLDLIESYLSIYPEQAEKLLFEDCRYRWYESRALVNPRIKRYHMTANGLRQYHALDEQTKAHTTRKWTFAGQQEARSTLIEKMLLLCAVKTATLDAAGMGVEMEGGKPGWYDALNGLPGLLGSSMAESCELLRLLSFVRKNLGRREGSVSLYQEIARLLEDVNGVLLSENDLYTRWDKMNRIKEDYRRQTALGFSGERESLDCQTLVQMLEGMEQAVASGIDKATELGGGICPTYFTFEATKIADTPDGPMPLTLEPHVLPLFLEGPVRWLKLDFPQEDKAALAQRVRGSGLYDRELHMYKVNDSLASVSFEAGRALAFTPGWLENGSIWLHMEYKYLLELLKSGLYTQFSQAFHDAAIPFLNPERYGRSPLENVSFLASSANPNPSVWGQGFVARLSGSTAEFLHIWQLMFFGPAPFRWEDGSLRLVFAPFVPGYLMPGDGVIEATFLGSVKVIYHASGLKELTPGKTQIVRWELTDTDGGKRIVEGPALCGKDACAVREGQITEIHITIK